MSRWITDTPGADFTRGTGLVGTDGDGKSVHDKAVRFVLAAPA